MLTARALLAALVVLPLALGPLAPVTAARRGPPLLCHPFAIGDAATLPVVDEQGRIVPTDDAGRLVGRAVGLLDEGDHVLAHLETLRRAVLALTADAGPEAVGPDLLVAALTARVQATAAREDAAAQGGWTPSAATTRRGALTRLDLAVALEALSEAGFPRAAPGAVRARLDRALAVLSGDGAARLAASLVAFGQGEQDLAWPHLQAALAAARDDPLLERNVCGTIGVNLGCSGADEVAARVREALGKV
jgi:hypothetical protein